jgi:predicted permease
MTRAARVALWLHERTLPIDEREAVVGDLLEEFEMRAARNPSAAARWVWVQTLRSFTPNLRRRFFNPRSTLESHPAHGVRMLNGLMTDLRFAVRLLRRQPLMTLVGFVSLTAGLGLNILLISLADAALFRPLPLRDPSRLALMLLQRQSGLMHNFSYPEYRDLRDSVGSLDGLVAYAPAEATVDASDGAVSIEGELVSGNFFAVFGVPMRAGRTLADLDDRAASPPAVVISEQLWRDRFGGAALNGQAVSLNGQPFTIVGVARRDFTGMQVGKQAAFWVPLAHSRVLAGGDYLSSRTVSWLTVVGRLGAGVAEAAARDELDSALRRVREATGRTLEPVVLRPGARGDSVLSESIASPLLVLLAAGGLVLLVACFNVANLQLARTEARRVELAVRSALGARRMQLVRLILLDGLLMALAAGGMGMWLAVMLKDRAASLIVLYGRPVSLSIPVDGRVVAAAALLSLLAAITIGLLTTWRTVPRQAPGGLGDGRPATASRRYAQRGLVVVQVALSMALLTGASLLVRTLDRLRQTDLGFDARRVAVLEVSPEMARLTGPSIASYFDDSLRAVTAMPGIEAAGVASVMPLDFGGSRTSIEVAGYRAAPDEDMELNFVRVSPGYFSTLGIPIRQGRGFDDRDVAGQPQRIIVNETMARRFWPDGRPVGRFVRYDDREPFNIEVIGVVPDVHYRKVKEDPRPSFYVSLPQMPPRAGVIHVRVAGDPSSSIEGLRRAVGAVNPSVPVTRAYTLIDQVERNIADERMAMAIGMTLAIVALLLATAGLYATMAFLVGRRTREIGVRMALGARAADVRSLVLKEGVTLACLGIAAGLALAAWVGHVLRHQIYGVSTIDVASLSAAAAILAGAALLASWLPARRASRVDPVVALRDI